MRGPASKELGETLERQTQAVMEAFSSCRSVEVRVIRYFYVGTEDVTSEGRMVGVVTVLDFEIYQEFTRPLRVVVECPMQMALYRQRHRWIK